MKRIAVPVENGILCTHFGHCQHFAIITVDGDEIIQENFLTPPPHAPGIIPKWLANNDIHEVIVGGIGQKAVQIFNANGIKVHAGAMNMEPKKLVQELVAGRLVTGQNQCDH